MKHCCLCAQISGRVAHDLLHEMLGEDRYERRAIDVGREFAAIPSIGPLTGCHVLLCPRAHARSFAALSRTQRRASQKATDDLESLLAQRWAMPLHLFEHGNSRHGRSVNCSVEHAHLHFVGSDVEVWPTVADEFPWDRVDGEVDISAVVGNREYLRYRDPDANWWIATTSGSFPSQMMRRAFAAAHGNAGAWNWRDEPAAARVRAIWSTLASVPGK